MTHYLLSVHGPAEMDDLGTYGSQEEMEEAITDTDAFNERLRFDERLVFAGGLESPSTARVVDGQGEEPVVTDGPRLGGDEALAGFWVVDLPDLTTALVVAAEASRACRGRVEVRPFGGVA